MTTDPRGWALLLALTLVSGCGPQRAPAPLGGPAGDPSRSEPALSGDGRLLASVIRLNGEDQVLLQELPGGRVLPLPPLRGHGPHRSPSLSWNGRYVAVILQRGARRQGVVLDRLSGRLQPLPTPAGAEPEGLSLAPDGQRIAMAVLERGRRRVRLLNLSGLLEPDQPPGQTLTGGGPP